MKSHIRLLLTSADVVLLAFCVLPFLIFLSVNQDIDMRAMLVTLLGAVAWLALWFGRHHLPVKIVRPQRVLLYVYLGCCLISLLVHRLGVNLYGSPLLRIGTLIVISSVGCGLLLTNISAQKLLRWLYTTSVGVAAVSIPYTLINLHHLVRLSGVFQQADVLAAWLAFGFVLGVQRWKAYPGRRQYIICCQALLLITLILTQTRAVILLLAVVLLIMTIQSRASGKQQIKRGAVIISSLTLLVVASYYVVPTRLSDRKDATGSVSYRLHLQAAALQSSTHAPLIGYGVGNISYALRCPTLRQPTLKVTCREGYYFDSSHNIFLDRILAFGYIGGLAFITFAGLSIYMGLRKSGPDQIFAYGALLLSLYFCTNVTNIELELLFWVLLLRPYRVAHE
jgi:O-antigen ligase